MACVNPNKIYVTLYSRLTKYRNNFRQKYFINAKHARQYTKIISLYDERSAMIAVTNEKGRDISLMCFTN